MKVVKLTKKLISIPSFVDNKTNEVQIGNYLNQLLPFKKQYIKNAGRFNLILPSKKPSLMVIGHIDTVPPQPGWNSNPFKPVVKKDRIYGLGAADMKGSLAAFLTALNKIKKQIDLKKLMLLIYVDEEYDFMGMKKFIKSKYVNINPQLVLSLDGSLQLESGCCGCIELNLKFTGKSGHSALPKSGVNAINKAVKITNLLKKTLTQFTDKKLGKTTINLAYLKGGRKLYGNIIPSECFMTLEIRPSVKKVNASWVIKRLKQLSQKEKMSMKVLKIRHDLGIWNPGKKQKTKKVIGYVDIQMLSDYIKPPMIVCGAGGSNMHGPNEFVPIKNLIKAENFYKKTLLKYCSK